MKIQTTEEIILKKLPKIELKLDEAIELFDETLAVVYRAGLQYSDLSVLRLQLGQVYLIIKQLNKERKQ